MARQGHRGLPSSGGTPRDVATRINQLLQGRLNSVGELTLTTGTAATAVVDINAGADSYIGFMPTTAAAAAEMNILYVSNRDTQTFTVTHGNSGTASVRSFVYLVIG